MGVVVRPVFLQHVAVNDFAAIAVEDRLAEEALGSPFIAPLIVGQHSVGKTSRIRLRILAIKDLIPDEAGIFRQVELDGVEERIEILDHDNRALGPLIHRDSVQVLAAVANAEFILHSGALKHLEQVIGFDLLLSLACSEALNCSQERCTFMFSTPVVHEIGKISRGDGVSAGPRGPGPVAVFALGIQTGGIGGEEGRLIRSLCVLGLNEDALHRKQHSLGKLSLELIQEIGGAIAHVHRALMRSSIGLGVGLHFLDTGSAMVGGMEFKFIETGQGG